MINICMHFIGWDPYIIETLQDVKHPTPETTSNSSRRYTAAGGDVQISISLVDPNESLDNLVNPPKVEVNIWNVHDEGISRRKFWFRHLGDIIELTIVPFS